MPGAASLATTPAVLGTHRPETEERASDHAAERVKAPDRRTLSGLAQKATHAVSDNIGVELFPQILRSETNAVIVAAERFAAPLQVCCSPLCLL
jgi:hypothetical protein